MAVPASTEPSEPPKSTHLSDPALQPFLRPAFDPADYLNATLPSLALSSASSRPLQKGHSVSLAELSSQTQSLLSQLNAQTTRLSTVLTQLTDDILRSGGRLAYEVEVLRGEAIGLTETLTGGLKGDVEKFLPGGIALSVPQAEDEAERPTAEGEHDSEQLSKPPVEESTTPEYLSQLRVLSLVRTRLETVIKVFGEAMHWTLPPSEISLASSLISVSAPEPGSDASSREQKAREFANALRTEISELITGEDSRTESALLRIQALRDLAQVWKGTAEEKARIKFVESLVKLVEDKQKALENANQRQKGGRSGSVHKTPAHVPPQKTGGFLDNLQRIRENIYME
ncbi:hypothetical protein K505DRAFT_320321 [Melanomma pulvis-pyrius CBS 109.77]|uniref:Uncharacterized protein n=1 Tax=Melanomma pulvis-pyrius CBS 109.77 TaxID=1314802 RepID=A0A6A6XWB7_9PLEO|nr:hypothetical protein K505DRAFT_320321 [Melanomma pulvis-pyrius CBS 109.77]